MILTMWGQAHLFLITVGIGLGAGLLYDMFRLLRKYIKHSNIMTHVEDLVFWLIVAGVKFYIFLNYYRGEIQVFFFLGVGIGMILYFGLFSRIFLKGAQLLVDFLIYALNRIYRILTAPFRALARLILRPIRFLFAKLGAAIIAACKKLKKMFHIIRTYVKIKFRLAKRNAGIILKKI